MLKRAAQQRFVAWLALAAMSLLVLMPVLSRSMPIDASMMGAAMDMTADMHMSMDMQHAGHGHPGMPGHPDDPTARCGYCVLLAHTPVVSLGVAMLLVPLDLPAAAPAAALPRATPGTLLLSAHPRGPPAAYSS